MSENIKSFKIITNEISLTSNNLPEKAYTMKPYISRKIGNSINQPNKYGIEMEVVIKDEKTNRFPINLKVRITGLFEIEGATEENIKTFLKTQGTQMLYPYLRTLVSTITAGAFMPAITLPIIQYTDFVDTEI